MGNILIPISAGTVPLNFCPAGSTSDAQWQTVANMLSGILTGRISSTDNLVRGQSTPIPADQGKLWVKLDAYGMPAGVFYFGGGQWVWPNPRPAASKERMIWVGTEAELWSHDGGDGADPGAFPPTAASGAMWMVDSAMAFRMPIGVGSNPVAYDGNPATVVALGGQGGEERHLLAGSETPMRDHYHQESLCSQYANDPTSVLYGTETTLMPGALPAALPINWSVSLAGGSTGVNALRTGPPEIAAARVDDGATLSHQNMPPFFGVYFAKRTARQYYLGS